MSGERAYFQKEDDEEPKYTMDDVIKWMKFLDKEWKIIKKLRLKRWKMKQKANGSAQH